MAIPIILYHSVNDRPQPGLQRWTVSRYSFREQVAAILDSGRTAMTVSELGSALRGERALPEQSIAITFDDGYFDTMSAVERLFDASLPATVYVTAGYLGRLGMMQQSDVVALSGAGDTVEIGGHGLTHRRLDELPPAELVRELGGSHAFVTDLIQRPCQTFAYPHGSYDRRVILAAQAAGFRSATAVKNALSHPFDDPFALARVTVTADMSDTDFGRTLRGELRLARSREAWRTRGYRWSRRLARRTTRKATTS
jgi:peptidoglycan/xylan/chitin deacetylase (PgdA/CDA1 family)